MTEITVSRTVSETVTYEIPDELVDRYRDDEDYGLEDMLSEAGNGSEPDPVMSDIKAEDINWVKVSDNSQERA